MYISTDPTVGGWALEKNRTDSCLYTRGQNERQAWSGRGGNRNRNREHSTPSFPP